MSEHSRKVAAAQVTKDRPPLAWEKESVSFQTSGLPLALIFERVEAETFLDSYGDIARVQVRNLRNHDGKSRALVRD